MSVSAELPNTSSLKVLHVTIWPGPPFSGANINSYNFLKRLTRHHRAWFIVVDNQDRQKNISSKALAELGINCEGLNVLLHRSPSISDRLRSILFSELPPYMAFLERLVGQRLREIVRTVTESWKPQVLMIWWQNYSVILARESEIPKVLYAGDSYSLAALNVVNHTSNPIYKLYYREAARRYRKVEQSIHPRFSEIVSISRRDADHAGPRFPARISIIPNGVDVESLFPADPSDLPIRPVIVFHGHLAYEPNAECVRFLVEQVGQMLERNLGADSFTMRIIGGGASAELSKLAHTRPWLEFTGYTEDLRNSLATGTIYVAPLVMGAGVKNKVLDAMACGLPVVGTDEAFSGLDVESEVHCVRSSRERTAEEVMRLIENPELRLRLGASARDWTVKNAGWDEMALRFEAVLKRACAG